MQLYLYACSSGVGCGVWAVNTLLCGITESDSPCVARSTRLWRIDLPATERMGCESSAALGRCVDGSPKLCSLSVAPPARDGARSVTLCPRMPAGGRAALVARARRARRAERRAPLLRIRFCFASLTSLRILAFVDERRLREAASRFDDAAVVLMYPQASPAEPGRVSAVGGTPDLGVQPRDIGLCSISRAPCAGCAQGGLESKRAGPNQPKVCL